MDDEDEDIMTVVEDGKVCCGDDADVVGMAEAELLGFAAGVLLGVADVLAYGAGGETGGKLLCRFAALEEDATEDGRTELAGTL